MGDRRPPRLVARLPDPGRGWIARGPGRWPFIDRTWTDLASARLVAGTASPNAPTIETDPGGDELVYVPPVALVHREARDRLIDALTSARVPSLVQLLPGESPGWDPASTGVSTVIDLTGPLIDGDLARLDAVPAGAWTLWPLVPGISDDASTIRDGCRRLAARDAGVVQPLAVEIAPVLAQRLAAGRPAAVFDALFHGAPSSERDFAAVAGAHGLSVWPERPDTGDTERLRINRRLAAALASTAELWLRLERPQAAGQALYRAARGVESTALDLVAVARDGNLRVLDFVDDRAAEVLEAAVAGEEPKLLRELRAAYVGAS